VERYAAGADVSDECSVNRDGQIRTIERVGWRLEGTGWALRLGSVENAEFYVPPARLSRPLRRRIGQRTDD